MKRALLILLALSFAATVQAHDLYEITSVVYVRTNQIELFMEMEFPTGMKLAGETPSREVAVASQFEAAQSQLRNLAGSFFEFTAGNNLVMPLRTNVELGVEDHIRLQVNFAPTPYRPLQFRARGLQGNMDAPYGTSLTVLDMVHQKVLGQTTLYVESPRAEFPPELKQVAPPESNLVAGTVVAPETGVPTNQVAPAPIPAAESGAKSSKSPWLPLLLGLGITVLLGFGARQLRAKQH